MEKIDRRRYRLDDDVLYKCPGICGYEITSISEAMENEDDNGTIFCPVCHQVMLEVTDKNKEEK